MIPFQTDGGLSVEETASPQSGDKAHDEVVDAAVVRELGVADALW